MLMRLTPVLHLKRVKKVRVNLNENKQISGHKSRLVEGVNFSRLTDVKAMSVLRNRVFEVKESRIVSGVVLRITLVCHLNLLARLVKGLAQESD